MTTPNLLGLLQPSSSQQAQTLDPQQPSSSGQVQRFRSHPRHLDLTWKSVRKAGESKYTFSSSHLSRRRVVGNSRNSTPGTSKKPKVTKEEHEILPLSSMPPSLFDLSQSSDLSNDYALHTSLNSDIEEKAHGSIINENDTYKYELKVHNAFVVCDDSLKSFVIQDFSCEDQCLKSHKYVQVSRCGKTFCGIPTWVYWCSCHSSRAMYIDALHIHIDDEYESVNLEYPECRHILVVKELAEEAIDSVYGIAPDYDLTDHSYSCKSTPHQLDHIEQADVISIGSEGAVCVKSVSGCGVVYTGERGLTCAFCKYQKHTCTHVNDVVLACQSDSIPKALGPISAHLNKETRYVHQKPRYGLQSTNKIPFRFGSQLSSTLQQSPQDRFHITDGICHLKEDRTTPCAVCGTVNWKDEVQETKVTVITRNRILPGIAYKHMCATYDCEGSLSYDGLADGLLSMKCFCVAYEVLRHHMYQFLLGRSTIYTEYCILCEDHRDCGVKLSSTLTYPMYLAAWYGFVSLLDIDYHQGFSCKVCQQHPNTVIMDATTLAFRKELDVWKDLFKPTQPHKSQIVDGRFSERVAVMEVEARRLLKVFAEKGLLPEDVSRMKLVLQKCLPSVIPVIDLAIVHTKGDLLKCGKEWGDLIHSLATASPACALIHPSNTTSVLVQEMSKRDITRDPSMMATLQKEIPAIHKLIQCLSMYPTQLSPLLTDLLCRSQAPFLNHVSPVPGSQGVDAARSDELSYFPCLPRVRERQQYHADKKAKEPICTKRTSRHPSMLPGVFTLFCEHGVCYGFEVMRVSESPNTPFKVLYERFKEAPNVIIYDNGCNLHQYMLNREPTFFKHTWVLVDRFHWPNHTGCSIGYKLDAYPQYNGINSQIVEQSNSTLKRIKPSLSYMNATNFISHMKLYIWYRNSTQSGGHGSV